MDVCVFYDKMFVQSMCTYMYKHTKCIWSQKETVGNYNKIITDTYNGFGKTFIFCPKLIILNMENFVILKITTKVHTYYIFNNTLVYVYRMYVECEYV